MAQLLAGDAYLTAVLTPDEGSGGHVVLDAARLLADAPGQQPQQVQQDRTPPQLPPQPVQALQAQVQPQQEPPQPAQLQPAQQQQVHPWWQLRQAGPPPPPPRPAATAVPPHAPLPPAAAAVPPLQAPPQQQQQEPPAASTGEASQVLPGGSDGSWEGAEVVVLEAPQQALLQRAVTHMQACAALGFDVKHTAALCRSTSNGASTSNGGGGGGGGTSDSTGSGAARQLALLQLFAPAACAAWVAGGSSRSITWPATVYVVCVPEDTAAAAQLLALFTPVLEGSQPIKVMHDARGDAEVLQRHFLVRLGGVLDTQLLHALSSCAAAGAAALQPGKDVDVFQQLPPAAQRGRISLQALHQLNGLVVPDEVQLGSSCAADPRLWFTRPLAPGLVARAAADVRCLLPLASRLLQQLGPSTLAHLATLQAALHVQQGLAAAAPDPAARRADMLEGAERSGAAHGAAAFGDERAGKRLLLFTLKCSERGEASFEAYTCEGPDEAVASSTGTDQQPNQQPGPEEEEDEATVSLLQLLPPELSERLASYRSTATQPALSEVFIDCGCPVRLRLSDGSKAELPGAKLMVDMAAALDRLAAAKAQLEGGSHKGSPSQAASQLGPCPAPAGPATPAARAPAPPLWLLGALAPADAGKPQRAAAHEAAALEPALLFGRDNRLRLPACVHRVSALRNREGRVAGLTFRLGRHVRGAALPLLDVLWGMKRSLATGPPRSLLLLGRPGVGKTTLLRDVVRLLADSLGLSVMVVDSNNEIAGDGDVAHSCIGSARRIMPPQRERQASVMLEAVHNHKPQVIVVDEISTPQEVEAARSIAQRGVLLVATAHGSSLDGLLRNPDLVPLVGGVQPVTLGDAEAGAATGGSKIQLQRSSAAPFTSVLEMLERDCWRLHPDVEESVDLLLQPAPPKQQPQRTPNTQLRRRDAAGRVLVACETRAAAERALAEADHPLVQPPTWRSRQQRQATACAAAAQVAQPGDVEERSGG